MTYNSTRILQKNPETEEQEINGGYIQMNLDLISQETNLLRDEITILKNSLKESGRDIEQSSHSFVHDFLFLGY